MVSPLEAIQGILDREEYGSVITGVDGPATGSKTVIDSTGAVVSGSLPAEIAGDVTADALVLMDHEQHRAMEYPPHTLFIESLAPPQEMVIFGAVHIGQSLASFASQMGYRVTVVDSRAAFATPERFPSARVLVGWPGDVLDQIRLDRRTWVIILSHDKRHEDPVLEAALKSPVRYIGAMGSRRSQDLRVERLTDRGFSPEDIARVRGPVGLDIGAESPQEVAVSILAEMTLVRYGHGTGLSLHGIEGRVHKQRPDDA
ncbi:MAG TPA: XdhC family protein [Acidimicrobiia bacterium]|nr:XdhC family protein [Acidimicrobiia bacterium]